ncbi:MAG TPA: hypothetical protein V6C72_16835 [Chroococcales cyanobacterium]
MARIRGALVISQSASAAKYVPHEPSASTFPWHLFRDREVVLQFLQQFTPPITLDTQHTTIYDIDIDEEELRKWFDSL